MCGEVEVQIGDAVKASIESGSLITQTRADALEASFAPNSGNPTIELTSESTLATIRRLTNSGLRETDMDNVTDNVGVLNFASAKNPGGGFLNGAMAQEESLAIASNLYIAQTAHRQYYDVNRASGTAMYTDTAIWSPSVVFFRDEDDELTETPFCADVLTLPAVNYGVVLWKGEDAATAERAMRRRMKIALAIFADMGKKCVVLGAYGCGVFGNNPQKIAAWWKELLGEYGGYFERVVFAVMDTSRSGNTYRAFEREFH
jgi:uncharacterized protein (TIGR02452 family)